MKDPPTAVGGIWEETLLNTLLHLHLLFRRIACLRLPKSTGSMKTMQTAKNRLALLASVIAVGVLLYSPLCSLSCAASDSSLLPKAKVAKQNEQSSHCHHHQDSEEQSTKSNRHSSVPVRHQGSSDCPTHTDSIALLSSVVRTPTVVHHGVPHVVAAFHEPFYSSFDDIAAKFAEGRPFRSPPKRAVISVYRI